MNQRLNKINRQMDNFIRINRLSYIMCKQIVCTQSRLVIIFPFLGVFMLLCVGHILSHCSQCASGLFQQYFTLTPPQQRAIIQDLFSFFVEKSIPSYFQYLVILLTALLLLLNGFLYDKKYLLFFGIVYGFVFVDDVFMFHESFVLLFSRNLNLPVFFNLREQDTGEILAWIIAFIVLSLFTKLLRGLNARDFVFSVLLSYSFSLLLFFGIFLDMVHSVTSGKIGLMVGSVEDAGECLALLVTLFLVFFKFHGPFFDRKKGLQKSKELIKERENKSTLSQKMVSGTSSRKV